MSIVLVGSTSGSITLQEPAVAGSTVLSLPATTGTVLTSASPSSDLPSSINGPAFSAYANAVQSLANGVFSTVALQTEEFDTNNNFASSTFTPTIAGYYQINGQVTFATTTALCFAGIFKNGTRYKDGSWANQSGNPASMVSAIVYMNGTTDTIQLFAYQASGGNLNTNNFNNTYANYLNGALVRSA